MRRLVALAPALAALLALPLGVAAAATDAGFRGCGSRTEVVDWLDRTFGEKPLARGVQGDGRLYELFAAAGGVTWTVVVTAPDGETCILSEGTELELAPFGKAGPVA